MKLLVFLLTTAWAVALPLDQVEAIRAAINGSKRAELPFVVKQLVLKASGNEQVKAVALAAVQKKHPESLKAVLSTLAENRPTTTPGNDHGKRPETPPGDIKRAYGSP